jgi:hypothetical protein
MQRTRDVSKGQRHAGCGTMSTRLSKIYVPANSNPNITQQRPRSARKSVGEENLRHKASEVGEL